MEIVAAIYHLCRKLWYRFSIKFLKRHLHIETPAYKKWWARRCDNIQRRLDIEHSAYPSF